MKTKMFVASLVLSVVLCCDSYAGDLLGRMLGRGGCGCETSCCDAPTHCGRGFHLSLDLHFHLPKLRNRCCRPQADCGCAAPAASCCDTGCGGGLLSNFGGFGFRNRGCCDTGCNTGCEQADPCCGRNFDLLGRVRGMIPNRCCKPACDTGCERTPRCRQPRQICIKVPNFGLIDRVRSMGCCNTCGSSSPCGCGAAAPAADAPASEGAVEPTPDAGTFYKRTPVVDPNAFIIRGTKFASGN